MKTLTRPLFPIDIVFHTNCAAIQLASSNTCVRFPLVMGTFVFVPYLQLTPGGLKLYKVFIKISQIA